MWEVHTMVAHNDLDSDRGSHGCISSAVDVNSACNTSCVYLVRLMFDFCIRLHTFTIGCI